MPHLRSLLKNASTRLAGAGLQIPIAVRDWQSNRGCRESGRFLVLRHSGEKPYFYSDYLRWLERYSPQVRARFELRLLPCRIRDLSAYVLHVPWLQDPVEEWSPASYARAQAIAATCDERGIPVVNRVCRISNSIKSVCSELIRGVGIRTPRVVRIDDPAQFRQTAGGMTPPFFIREDRRHGGPVFFVSQWSDVEQIPFRRFLHPVAVEFIDVRDPHDGCYRKYRYFAAGPWGMPRHLIVANYWEVRPRTRVVNEINRAAELEFLTSHDPNHLRLQAARRALRLDVCAFDYSYDQAGELVVWEVNSYPELGFSKNPLLGYARPFVERTFATLTKFYLQTAGIDAPPRLSEFCSRFESMELSVA